MENEVLNQDIVEPENLDDLNDLKDPSYAIGCWNYKTVWSWLLNPFERWVYLARVTITILQTIFGFICLVVNSTDNYSLKLYIGLFTGVHFITLMAFPTAFRLPYIRVGYCGTERIRRMHYILKERERKRMILRFIVDMVLFGLFITGIVVFKVYGLGVLLEHSRLQVICLSIFLVVVAITISTPVLFAVLAFCSLLCIKIYQVVENMRDRYEARAAELAETNLAELIQSFPIFWYRTQPPEEKNKPPVIAVVNPKKPIKRFRMFKLFQTRNKTNSEDRQYLSVPEEDAMCAICIGEYRDDDLIRQLGCNHHFHVACIDKWLHIHARCPMCVKDIAQMA
ncbi:hypothetical protein BC833DRAFT_585385 [Globomyces pollinis-pini]|nr:hypothetical protein BC833DRAFT_585385 [Globomyces pollinis-pini]